MQENERLKQMNNQQKEKIKNLAVENLAVLQQKDRDLAKISREKEEYNDQLYKFLENWKI